jgi:hypothetical protein
VYDDRPATESSKRAATTPHRIGVGLGAVLVLIGAAAVAYDSSPGPSNATGPHPAADPNPVAAPIQGRGSPRPSPSLTETAVLPDLVGKPVQRSRSLAQAAGFSTVTSRDATGEGRVPIAEDNWKVCTQNPLPGTHPTFTKVELTATHLTEPCPR